MPSTGAKPSSSREQKHRNPRSGRGQAGQLRLRVVSFQGYWASRMLPYGLCNIKACRSKAHFREQGLAAGVLFGDSFVVAVALSCLAVAHVGLSDFHIVKVPGNR